MPISRDLRHNVHTLLRRGERAIVLDLAGVSKVDAAGIGELVRAYNMTSDKDGWLRIVHAKDWVREILQRAGVFELLSADRRAP
jgi:anti-anti-sigma factor